MVKEYLKKELILLISDHYGKFNRYIINGIYSLVSTLENTPFGDKLKQGKVIKRGTSRIIIKEGDPKVNPLSILYLLYKRAKKEGIYSFELNQLDKHAFSPQKVFTISTSKVINLLRSLWLPEFLRISFDEDKTFAHLSKDKDHIDIIKIYISRRHYK